MASLIKQDNGRYTIQLNPSEKSKRPKIAIGRVNKRLAMEFKRNIENLIQSKTSGCSLSASTNEWLLNLPDGVRLRLSKLGLVEAPKKDYGVVEWIEMFIEQKEKSPYIQTATVAKYKATYRKMKVFFHNERLSDVTVPLARRFRDYLKDPMGLGENTISKHICQAKEMFAEAIRHEIIFKNPFDGQKTNVTANPERFFFVTPKLAQEVMDAMPTTEWKLIFALARFGGLRIPSELKNLRWVDIHFDKKFFTVHATKTAHHGNMGVRQVPLFPEIEPVLLEQYDQTPEGNEYVISDVHREGNVGTHFKRMLRTAGIPVWVKPFQNCRSSRETELFKLTGGNIKAVCSWIGNTEMIALKHYAQVTDADIRQAAAMGILDNGLKKVSEKTVHNPVHKGAETTCKDKQETSGGIDVSSSNCRTLQEKSPSLQDVAKRDLMGDTGLEPVTPCL